MKTQESMSVTIERLDELVRRMEPSISAEDHALLEHVVSTLVTLAHMIAEKRMTITRLRKLLFGAKTESRENVTSRKTTKDESDDSDKDSNEEDNDKEKKKKRGGKPKGQGRLAADAYTGADTESVPHQTLALYECCPGCERGTLYPMSPGIEIRLVGQAPIGGTVYELEKMRCGLCGEIFTAELPDEVGTKKYDESVASMIAALKYGCGMPFYRLQKLQDDMGIPLRSSTQWDIVSAASVRCSAAFEELIRQAAQGDVLYNDDTAMKILGLPPPEPGGRKGVFTSGIVSTGGEHPIVIFDTGRTHGGESLTEILARREDGRAPPIQMCDGLSRNVPEHIETIVSNCLAHGRRKFVEIADYFPKECEFVIDTLADVYHHDAIAKEQQLSATERLAYHKKHSTKLMKTLKEWLDHQIDQRLVEPNSSLGKAINYMRNRWDEMTLFLREPGAPLDNNITERALKMAILHRKNALYFRSQRGANVADLFMSLIHTARLSGAHPVHYLTALMRDHERVADSPEMWMPWNYTETLRQRRAA